MVAVGFTRPDGLAILAVRQGPAEFRLQRYTLKGQLEASLASLPRKGGAAWPANGCVSACALSSPDGYTDVWGIVGGEMQVVGNGGGRPHKLHVKGSGHPSCVPLTWWDDSTVLANCVAAGGAGGTTQLWLLSTNGGPPTPLTNAAGSASGNGDIQGAWQANGAVYITQVSFNQCPNVPSGPGGLNIVRLGQGGSTAAITIRGSTHNVSTVVATDGSRLLVLTQTQCPGTSSLLWINPSTGATQVAVNAPGNEVGVIAAVPFGNGPTAITSGQFSSG